MTENNNAELIEDTEELAVFADSDEVISPEGHVLYKGLVISVEGEILGYHDVNGKLITRFEIKDQDGVDWFLRKLRNHEQSLLAQWIGLAKAIDLSVKAIKREKAAIKWLRDSYTDEVKLVYDSLPKQKGKKSISGTLGVMGYRAKKFAIKVLDEAKAVEWLKACLLENCVRIKEEVVLSGLYATLEREQPDVAVSHTTPEPEPYKDLSTELFEQRLPGEGFYVEAGLKSVIEAQEKAVGAQVKYLREQEGAA